VSQHAEYNQFNLKRPCSESSEKDLLKEKLLEEGIVLDKIDLSPRFSVEDKHNDLVMDYYQGHIDRIKNKFNYACADMTRVSHDSLHAISIRGKNLSEHTHQEDEVRLILEGSILIYVHINENVHIIHCEKGDFIMVPGGVKHWMDIGPSPNFACIRWYNSKSGLVTQFTGSHVAESTSRWETIFSEDHFKY